MRLILNRRFFILILTALFMVLVLLAPRFHADAPGYSYLVDDWDIITPTRPPPTPGPTPPPRPISGAGGINFRFVNPSFHLVSLPDGNTVRRFYGVDTWVESLIPSPNLQHGIIRGNQGFLATHNVLELLTGEVRPFVFDKTLREPNVWSPDSAYLTVAILRPCTCQLVSYYADLGIVDVNTGAVRALTDGALIALDDRSIAWSPDASALVYVDTQFDPSMARADTVKWISVNGDQPSRALLTRAGASGTWLRWLPDGENIAVIAMAAISELWFINVESGQTTYHYAAAENFDTCWSPTSDHFVIASRAGFALITPDGAPSLDTSFVDPSIWAQIPAADDSCAWSPDGRKLVLVTRNPSAPPVAQVIDFEKRSVSEIRVNHPAPFLIPYWSPDSRMLAFKTYRPFLNSGDTYIYDTATMQQVYYQTHANFLTWLPQLP